jgi:hypothetical protein
MPYSNKIEQPSQNTSTIQRMLRRFSPDNAGNKKAIQAILATFTPDQHQKLDDVLGGMLAHTCTKLYARILIDANKKIDINDVIQSAWQEALQQELDTQRFSKQQTSAKASSANQRSAQLTKQSVSSRLNLFDNIAIPFGLRPQDVALTSTISHREMRSYGANEDTFAPITFQFAKEKQSKRKEPPTKTKFTFNPKAKPFTPSPSTQKKASPPLHTTAMYG